MRATGVGLMLLLAACAGTAPSAAPDALPEPSHWRLVGSSDARLQGDAAAAVRLTIAEGRLSGDSGCNEFSAGYSLANGALQMQPLISTKRGCAPPAGEVEQALYAVLREATRADLRDGRLRLTTGDGRYVEFLTENSARP